MNENLERELNDYIDYIEAIEMTEIELLKLKLAQLEARFEILEKLTHKIIGNLHPPIPAPEPIYHHIPPFHPDLGPTTIQCA